MRMAGVARAAVLISFLWAGCRSADPPAPRPAPGGEPTAATEVSSGAPAGGVSSGVAAGVSSGPASGGVAPGGAAGGEGSSEAAFVSRRPLDRVVLALPAADRSVPYVVARDLGYFTEEDIRIEVQVVDADAALHGVLAETHTFAALAVEPSIDRLSWATLRVVFRSDAPPSLLVTSEATLAGQAALVKRFLRGSVKGFWSQRAVPGGHDLIARIREELRPTATAVPPELFSYGLAHQALDELAAEVWRPR